MIEIGRSKHKLIGPKCHTKKHKIRSNIENLGINSTSCVPNLYKIDTMIMIPPFSAINPQYWNSVHNSITELDNTRIIILLGKNSKKYWKLWVKNAKKMLPSWDILNLWVTFQCYWNRLQPSIKRILLGLKNHYN